MLDHLCETEMAEFWPLWGIKMYSKYGRGLTWAPSLRCGLVMLSELHFEVSCNKRVVVHPAGKPNESNRYVKQLG